MRSWYCAAFVGDGEFTHPETPRASEQRFVTEHLEPDSG
jgi:hypothetical protein